MGDPFRTRFRPTGYADARRIATRINRYRRRDRMTEPAFTPGPWSYRSQPHDDWGIVRAGRYVICQARNPESNQDYEARARQERFDPFEANARLIAAAPELFEALGGLVMVQAGLPMTGVEAS